MNAPKNTIKHIAIIMDGNRRWAKKQGLGAINGHQHVVDNVIEPLVDRCIELGIKYLTFWAFSTENWERDKIELEGMMQLFRHAFERKVEDLHKKGVRLQILGEINKFPKDIAEQAKRWVEISKNNTNITASFALNYGGRDEITRAVKKMVQLNPSLGASQVTEQKIQSYLDTSSMPDPDLIIRPGGQLRLSGFMPWQGVYSELYFTDVLMPEFTVAELDKALADFTARQRRFGK
ncbi:MAG: di-trans,poly-cis-decaprenylcistransferase [Candidatus Pacebacteria bacterium RIFCSPHIGHO2_01_FULL_46_10]|nr:MAG: di-trans,poly-cis-decaprenylcistransferase [Candidatus Pacebacteria bacterium RIFCSPHIGHO2_01_FULL_46_10]